MIIPVGEHGAQALYLLEKLAGKIERRAVLPVHFVPMKGQAKKSCVERRRALRIADR